MNDTTATTEPIKVRVSASDLDLVCRGLTMIVRDEFLDSVALDLKGGEMAGLAHGIARIILTEATIDALKRGHRAIKRRGDDGNLYALRMF